MAKKIFYLCPLCFIAILFLSFFYRSATPKYDYPPLIVINGSTYKGTNHSIAQLPHNSIYLGTVMSSVPSSEVPIENFQANDELTGALIYQIENDVVIYHANQWWIYSETK